MLVVVGHRATEIGAAVRLPPRARFVHNPYYAEGQSTSLRAGLRAADPASGAAVVLLGDQPGVLPAAIAAVVQAWRSGEGPAAQASYGGRPGHPTLFDRSLWLDLERSTGDEGARSLLAVHPEWLRPVAAGDRPPDDIDTEEDYARVRAAFESR
ncbi:MAG: nucleotidyltransferase family protein [Actinobacteria bacterium]|nr:MAG: nucleotidyltransferase family protein [Actinomycetota bacterium]